MVMSCAAYGCTNRWIKDKSRQFHRFPLKDPDRLKLWLQAMKRASFHPSKYSFLCSDHFSKESYKKPHGRFLKKDAVPSIFNFPKTSQKPVQTRRTIKKHPLPVKKPNSGTGSSEDIPTHAAPTVFTTAYISERDSTIQPFMSCSPLSPVAGGSTEIDNQRHSEYIQDMDQNLLNACVSNTILFPKYNNLKRRQQSPTKLYLRRKVKLLQQKVRRLEKKVTNLESLLNQAKQFGNMTDETIMMLRHSFGELPFEIFVNQLQNSNKKPQGRRYTSQMKQFALTLYFYSHRSYNYLRGKIHLPDDATIRSWISSYDCYPGFLEESFKFLRNVTLKGSKFEDCALIIDSMSIRAQTVWDSRRNKFTGYVECVGLVDGKEDCLATEALVFLIVSLTHKFKCPVAYFLIDKLNTNVLSQLIKICIGKLRDINVRVWSVTADGLAANVSAFEALGCQLTGRKAADIQPYFFHPCSNDPIYVIMDPCHMVKLARNVLAEKNLSSEKGSISWHYLKELNKLQSEIGFNFSNKLSGAHVNYHNKKMNVALASQTLSRSTADALEFLCKANDYRFVGAEATIEYMRYIDRGFDLLNSRNPFGKGYKTPLNLKNQNWANEILEETIAS